MRGEYLDLARELKCIEHIVDGYTNCCLYTFW